MTTFRPLSCLLAILLAAVSSRNPSPGDAPIPKRDSPRPTRRALLASTVHTTVDARAVSEPVRDPAPRDLEPLVSNAREVLPVSPESSVRLGVQSSRPDYLKPFLRSSPGDVLAPPRV